MAQPAGIFAFGKKHPSPREEERRVLLRELGKTRASIAHAYTGFNSAQDPDLIESYVFEINALQARYAYLLRRVKGLEREEG